MMDWIFVLQNPPRALCVGPPNYRSLEVTEPLDFPALSWKCRLTMTLIWLGIEVPKPHAPHRPPRHVRVPWGHSQDRPCVLMKTVAEGGIGSLNPRNTLLEFRYHMGTRPRLGTG